MVTAGGAGVAWNIPDSVALVNNARVRVVDTGNSSVLGDSVDFKLRGGLTLTAPASGVSLSEMIRSIYDDTNSLDGTKIPQTLNLTASGNIGIDWANVENPTTALDLSATDIQLVYTATAVTNDVGIT